MKKGILSRLQKKSNHVLSTLIETYVDKSVVMSLICQPGNFNLMTNSQKKALIASCFLAQFAIGKFVGVDEHRKKIFSSRKLFLFKLLQGWGAVINEINLYTEQYRLTDKQTDPVNMIIFSRKATL